LTGGAAADADTASGSAFTFFFFFFFFFSPVAASASAFFCTIDLNYRWTDEPPVVAMMRSSGSECGGSPGCSIPPLPSPFCRPFFRFPPSHLSRLSHHP